MEVLVAFIGLLTLFGMFWQLLGLINPKIARANSKCQALKRAGLCLLTVIVLIILTPSPNSVPVSEEGVSAKERRGNIIGNIVNGGFVAQEGEWIYYTNYSDDLRESNKLYKMRTDGSGRTKLCDDRATYLNVVDGWIYYVNNSDDSIYKIRTDGNGRTKLCDDKATYLNVVDGWIYYVNNSDVYSIYKIRTDGSGRTKLNNDVSSEICVVNGWIYYTKAGDGIFKIRTDGSKRTKICDEKAKYINIVDGWIYYTNGNYAPIYKIQTDGSGRTKLCDDSARGICVVDGWVYYISSRSDWGTQIYKISTDGLGRTKICSIYFDCTNINIADDWIYSFDNPKFKVRTDGTNHTRLTDYLHIINVYDGWIYFVGEYSYDEARIYKARIDGSGRTKLCDDRVAYTENGKARILNGWIYYLNESDGYLYKMRLDGSSRTNLKIKPGYYFYVTEDWIYYSNASLAGISHLKIRTDGTGSTTFDNSLELLFYLKGSDGWIYFSGSRRYGNLKDAGMYKMSIDGNYYKKLVDDSACSFIHIVGEWIYYYSNDNKAICKILKDGGGHTIICDDAAVKEFSVADGWIYYINNDNNIYKVRIDGSSRTKLNDDWSSDLCVADGWIYYVNHSDYGSIYKIRTDGSGRTKLDQLTK